MQLRGHDTEDGVWNRIFSGSRLDLGTSVLLKQAPEPPRAWQPARSGLRLGADRVVFGHGFAGGERLGVGWNERALELTALNAKRNGCGNVRTVRTDADALPVEPDAISPDLTFDAIWSNPPIRIGEEALHTLLMNWLPRLSDTGTAYLVVQKNLGADSLIEWLSNELGDGYAVSKYHSAKGFRVIEVSRTA